MEKKITLTTGEEFILNLPVTDNDYRLLGRLKEDCEYYLGYGARQNKHLYYKDEEKIIVAMTEIYDSLVEKPEWLTIEQIAAYEEQMLRPIMNFEEYLKNFDFTLKCEGENFRIWDNQREDYVFEGRLNNVSIADSIEELTTYICDSIDEDMQYHIENHIGPWGMLEEKPICDYESFINEYKDRGGFAKNYLFKVMMCTAIPRLISLS